MFKTKRNSGSDYYCATEIMSGLRLVGLNGFLAVLCLRESETDCHEVCVEVLFEYCYVGSEK